MKLNPLDLQIGDTLHTGHVVVERPVLRPSGDITVTLKTPGGVKTTQNFNPKLLLIIQR